MYNEKFENYDDVLMIYDMNISDYRNPVHENHQESQVYADVQEAS